MTLWPDNQAHGFSSTIGAELPMKSRYMGTVSYTMMRQNQAFVPSISPLIFTNAGNTVLGAPTPLPASSLNGAIDTFLSNNVVTTQITPTLKSKLSYRYYNFDNNTPELLFSDWTLTDVKSANITTATYAPVSSISVSYNKQNAAADSGLVAGSALESRHRLWLRALQVDARGRRRDQREFRQGVRRL